MRVFVAGATGVIGRSLLPLLRQAGHDVIGMTRSAERADALREQGVEPVVCDAFDADAVERAVVDARPEVVVNELTDFPKALDPRKAGDQLASHDRIREEGTRNLMRGAEAAGARRLVSQSIAFAYAPGAPRSSAATGAAAASSTWMNEYTAVPGRTSGNARLRTASAVDPSLA